MKEEAVDVIADAETIRSYQQFGKIVDKIKLKGDNNEISTKMWIIG